VLQVSTEADLNEVKRAYKKLSILVHPDKNPDDRERAQKAFDGKKARTYVTIRGSGFLLKLGRPIASYV
jgi:curved DNA-binding protein CbpA